MFDLMYLFRCFHWHTQTFLYQIVSNFSREFCGYKGIFVNIT